MLDKIDKIDDMTPNRDQVMLYGLLIGHTYLINSYLPVSCDPLTVEHILT